MSFFWKILSASVAVILITAAGVYMAALPSIEDSLEGEAEQLVAGEAAWAQRLCESAFDRDSQTFDLRRLQRSGMEQVGSRFTLVLPDGAVAFDSDGDAAGMDNHAGREEIRSPGKAITRFSRTLKQEMTYFALPLEIAGELRGYCRVSIPVQDRESRLVGLRSAIRTGAFLAVLFALVLAGLFARRVARPLSEIAELVTLIGSSETTRRLQVKRGDEVGQVAQAVNTLADALQSKTTQVERDRAERVAILSALAGGLLAVDHEQRVLFINNIGRELLGGLDGSLKGQPVWELSRNGVLLDVIQRCLANHERTSGETVLEGEGGDRVLEIMAVTMDGADGEVRGCVLELRDVTDLRRLEAVRRDFVSNVSHELKTPLTAMRGYTEAILEDEDMPPELRRSFLEKACKNTERLTAIVSDLLSLSRLESDETDLVLEPMDPAELTQAVFQDLHDLAESRQTTLVLEEDDQGPRVQADPQALGMAISNLVSNAIQYSPENGVVRVVVSSDVTEVRLDVIDQGPGIPLHAQERIFERFYRIDKARSRKLGGTGLGLSIVRHAMSAQGGRVELESEHGHGCRFSLFLPRL
ncbi:MAG: two-component system phosphate regulon sensor histidine kinase PhoR [Planctomycetota bacterium]|jgi:two-component system phosphate regulon sensor histidine kinase PhoR